jgi:hypothetical protein
VVERTDESNSLPAFLISLSLGPYQLIVLPAREDAGKNRRAIAIKSCRTDELRNEPNKWFIFNGWIERECKEFCSSQWRESVRDATLISGDTTQHAALVSSSSRNSWRIEPLSEKQQLPEQLSSWEIIQFDYLDAFELSDFFNPVAWDRL